MLNSNNYSFMRDFTPMPIPLAPLSAIWLLLFYEIIKKRIFYCWKFKYLRFKINFFLILRVLSYYPISIAVSSVIFYSLGFKYCFFFNIYN
jgi:hypothetical protein